MKIRNAIILTVALVAVAIGGLAALGGDADAAPSPALASISAAQEHNLKQSVPGNTNAVDLMVDAANTYYLTQTIADGSAEATYYQIAPYAGTISKIRTVTNAAVSTADITLTCNIGATAITGGVVTIATAASAAGDLDTATPTALNTITAGAALNCVVTGGGAGGAPRIDVVYEITR